MYVGCKRVYEILDITRSGSLPVPSSIQRLIDRFIGKLTMNSNFKLYLERMCEEFTIQYCLYIHL